MSDERTTEIPVFPFSAIVGQEKAKLALLCNAVNPAIGGVLLSGDKGCGKSTMVRALADVLPEIDVVKGCPFNCNPHSELEMCDSCREKAEKGELEVEKRKMTVVDLPLSVSVDRLVGTIDVEKVLKEKVRALQPGILAKANRNILYIDEVNLLEDYVADVLLDSAAMGWNVVEREGISLKHPARFILVGSMNPEEGELRPQILDRFGLFVRIEAVRDVEERMEILRRVEEFQKDPAGFRKKYEADQNEIRSRVERAREILGKVEIDEELLRFLVKTIVDLGIKTHRAEIATIRTAKAIAALDGRRKVSLEDLNKAMELALPHRLRDRPFDSIPDALDSSKKPEGDVDGSNDDGESKTGRKRDKTESGKDDGEEEENQRERPGNRQKNVECGKENVKLFESRPERVEWGSRGKSRKDKTSRIGGGRGFHIYSVPAKEMWGLDAGDLDIFGTLKNFACGNGDVLVKVRKVNVPRLTAIVLDVSGSMLARKRVELATSIAGKLVEKGYVNREYLALLTFGGNGVEVKAYPTRKYSDVLEALKKVKVGGKTPLSLALEKTFQLSRSFYAKNRNGGAIRAILITDGRANVSKSGNVKKEVANAVKKLVESGVFLEVYDTRKFEFLPSLVDVMEENGAVIRRVF